MAKKRSAESYTGNTPEAKINQRRNLIPGNAFNKRRTRVMKLDCWWEGADLESKQFIFEGWEKRRDIEKVPKDELLEERELDIWWRKIDIELKKAIHNSIMQGLDKGQRTRILDNVDECLKEKLADEKRS